LISGKGNLFDVGPSISRRGLTEYPEWPYFMNRSKYLIATVREGNATVLSRTANLPIFASWISSLYLASGTQRLMGDEVA
jgi:hypothetical protein